MASGLTTQGLQDGLDLLYSASGIDAMGLSTGTGLGAGTTTLAAFSHSVKALTSNTRSGQVRTVRSSWAAADVPFTATAVTLHDDGVGVPTGVQGYVDGFQLTLEAGATVEIELQETDS